MRALDTRPDRAPKTQEISMRTASGGRSTRRRFLVGTGATAAGLAILPQPGLAGEEPKLNFYNWDT